MSTEKKEKVETTKDGRNYHGPGEPSFELQDRIHEMQALQSSHLSEAGRAARKAEKDAE